MNKAIIACGSNLNNSEKQLISARKKLASLGGVKLLASSSFYKTKPVSMTEQPDFLNGAFLVETTLNPDKLFRKMLEIEESQERKRGIQNGPRTLDLDLIFYGNETINKKSLTLPHPRAHEREFVLRPIVDIAPLWVHPTKKKTVEELLFNLK